MILFADNHLIVALKPSGLLTQPSPEVEDSLESRVKQWVKSEYKKEGNVFLHAIHRLDRPVSGLVLFAKTSKALSRLNEMSRNQEIQRIYVAEVEGVLPFKEGKLDHYLIHQNFKAVVGKKGDLGAKHARLSYKVLEYRPSSTLVSIELETGRYHQIRCQFAASNYPIVGDQKYGAKMGGKQEIHLHCSSLQFIHPVTKEPVSVESPVLF